MIPKRLSQKESLMVTDRNGSPLQNGTRVWIEATILNVNADDTLQVQATNGEFRTTLNIAGHFLTTAAPGGGSYQAAPETVGAGV
jgi:phage gp45-like